MSATNLSSLIANTSLYSSNNSLSLCFSAIVTSHPSRPTTGGSRSGDAECGDGGCETLLTWQVDSWTFTGDSSPTRVPA